MVGRHDGVMEHGGELVHCVGRYDSRPGGRSGASDDVIFNITTANGAETVSLGANQSANSLTFNNTGTTTLNAGGTNRTLTLGTGGITVNPGAGAVTLGNSGSGQNVNIYLNGTQTWVNNSSNTLNINNTIFTPGGVTQTLTFDGSANITSITAISSSILSPLSIVKNGTNTVQLSSTGTSTSNLYAGTLTVNSGTFNIGGGDMYVGGLAGSGTIGIGISQSKWFRDYQSGNSTFSGVLQNGGGTLGLYKDAAGTLTLNGSVVNTCTGTTTSQGGTLLLDFAYLATPTNLMSSSSGLSLAGGNLTIKGNSSGATSQTFNGLSLGTDSYSSITLNPNGGTSTTLAVGAVPTATISAAGTNYGRAALYIDVSSAAGGTMSITTSTANGTQLPYAVVQDAAAGSVDLGIISGGNIVRMSAWTALPTTGAGSTTTDYNVTANWTKLDTTAQAPAP